SVAPGSERTSVKASSSRDCQAVRVCRDRNPSAGFSPQQKMWVWASTTGAGPLLADIGLPPQGKGGAAWAAPPPCPAGTKTKRRGAACVVSRTVPLPALTICRRLFRGWLASPPVAFVTPGLILGLFLDYDFFVGRQGRLPDFPHFRLILN